MKVFLRRGRVRTDNTLTLYHSYNAQQRRAVQSRAAPVCCTNMQIKFNQCQIWSGGFLIAPPHQKEGDKWEESVFFSAPGALVSMFALCFAVASSKSTSEHFSAQFSLLWSPWDILTVGTISFSSKSIFSFVLSLICGKVRLTRCTKSTCFIPHILVCSLFNRTQPK